MDFDEAKRLIQSGESEVLEFKKSTAELRSAGETLCAFLNGTGGTVIIGVTPRGRISGQVVADSTQVDIATIVRKLEPARSIDLSFVPIPGSELRLILLKAPAGGLSVPFTYDGRPYQRIGTMTCLMPQERYQQLLLQRMHSHQRWENIPALGVALKDLDQEEILRMARLGMATGRIPDVTGANPAEILDRLGLVSEQVPLNAAVVLFGKQFLPSHPQCQMRMARFKGTTKVEFLDNRQIYGNGFALLTEAMIFLQRHLPVAGRIQPGLFERVDEPLFPLVALREALVNAVCHRDYANPGGAISLAIYDDRLEIWSDGTLPFGLKVQDLKTDHTSRPRNPLIADAFFRRGFVERWGRGTQLIVELCVQAGHPEPEFVEQAGAVGVRFLPSGYTAPLRVAYDLTPRQREIMQILASTPDVPLGYIHGQLEDPPAERTLQDDLSHLKRLGLIRLQGRGRGAIYRLQ